MPHSSRKKKPLTRPKRQEILDENGWTRIMTAPKEVGKMTSLPNNSNSSSSRTKAQTELYEPDVGITGWNPTSVPPDATLEKIQAKYQKMEKIWLNSESWKSLQQALSAALGNSEDDALIDTCMLFGSGSYCGSVNDWIARHDVALVQTAIFQSEPTYNSLDKAFLQTLGIKAVDDPEGFSLVTKSSFAYTPGAEQFVTMRTLFRQPRIYLSHQIDDMYYRNSEGKVFNRYTYRPARDDPNYKEAEAEVKANSETNTTSSDPASRHGDPEWIQEEEWYKRTGAEYHVSIRDEYENSLQVIERFHADHEAVKLPDLDIQDLPFHEQYLNYRKSVVEEEENVRIEDGDEDQENSTVIRQ